MDEVSVNARKHTALMAICVSGKPLGVMLGPWLTAAQPKASTRQARNVKPPLSEPI